MLNLKSETQRRLEMTNTKIIHKIKTSKKLKVFKKVGTQKKIAKDRHQNGLQKIKNKKISFFFNVHKTQTPNDDPICFGPKCNWAEFVSTFLIPISWPHRKSSIAEFFHQNHASILHRFCLCAKIQFFKSTIQQTMDPTM